VEEAEEKNYKFTKEKLNCEKLAEIIWLDNDYFEKIGEKPKSIYDLKEGDVYYTLENEWSIHRNAFYEYVYDEKVISMWNTFLTREEAEQELNKRKSLAKIKKWSWENDNGYEFDDDEENYYIQYLLWYKTSDLIIDYELDRFNYWTQYYSSEEIAEKALSELREEYNILFDLTV
jgi:hypothetical protein